MRKYLRIGCCNMTVIYERVLDIFFFYIFYMEPVSYLFTPKIGCDVFTEHPLFDSYDWYS